METPATILAWAVETFGAGDPLSIATRSNVEVAELINGVNNLREAKNLPWAQRRERILAVRGEVIDVWIMWSQLAEKLGVEVNTPDYARMPAAVLPQDVCSLNVGWALFMNSLLYWTATADEPPRALSTLIPRLHPLFQRLSHMADSPSDLLAFHAAVDAKMEINRKRQWRVTDTGQRQHVEEENKS